jgi:hypothetical protein
MVISKLMNFLIIFIRGTEISLNLTSLFHNSDHARIESMHKHFKIKFEN